MHYRNGREAKNGDMIVQIGGYGSGAKITQVGILYDAKPGHDHCNGQIAVTQIPGQSACLCDCLLVSNTLTLGARGGGDPISGPCNYNTEGMKMKSFLGDVVVVALLCLLALFASVRFVYGQPRQAPPVLPEQAPPITSKFTAYAQAKAYPVVVFVGVKPREIEGVQACVEPVGFLGYKEAVIVFNGKQGGYAYGSNVSDAAIRRAAGLEQPVSASPFRQKIALPDAPHHDAGSLPASIRAMLRDGVRYKKAEYTQEIAVTNGRDRITPVPIANIASKWHQPGGMEGIRGWRSDLYRHIAGGKTWIGDIGVRNSFGFIQNNRGHKRSYDDGTWFADVLSTNGNVFEVRVREKHNGEWSNYVAFKNPSARPDGYTGLRQSCASCHQEAGTGGYATGLVPGGDETLSDPFEGLEQ